MDDAHEIHLAVPVLGESLDELPPELQKDYELQAQFKAYVRESRIAIGTGDMMITLGIPYEDKYNALPMTDLRGVTFLIGVYRPIWTPTPDAMEVPSEWINNG